MRIMRLLEQHSMIGLEHGREVIGLGNEIINGLLFDHELKERQKVLLKRINFVLGANE